MKTIMVTPKTILVSFLLGTICASVASAAAPPTPTGLVATASLETHVALSWAAASGATSYNIYRSTTPGTEALLTTNILSNTFENSGLSLNGTLYYYKVAAVNSSGTSGLSSEVSVTTKTAGASGITATAGNSQVSLTWPSAPTATSYKIYRDTLGGPGGTTNFVVTGSTSYTDTGLVNGTKYWYEVDAINAAGENFAYYAVGSATPTAGAQAPAGAPAQVAATAGNGQALLRWLPVSNATSYSVYRSTAPGTETLLSSGVTGNTFSDGGLSNGTAYYYKMQAVSASGSSALSSEVTATPYIPSTPTLTVTGGKGQIVLTWTGNGTSYAVYRGGTTGSETLLNSGVTGNTFTDAGLANSTTYYYKVQGLNASGSSALSSEISGQATGLATSATTITVSFGIPNEPVQSCSLYIPDVNRPINGALFYSMQSLGGNLKTVMNKYNIAVFSTGFYAFVTSSGTNTLLNTSDDTGHNVQVIDYRWPQLSAQRIQAALTAASAQVSGHPEIQYTGVIAYGFSEGCCNVNLAVSQSALANRILAVVQLSELDEDHYGPVSIMDTAPHLFLASSYTNDPYSALNQANPDYTGAGVSAATYDVEARGLTTNQGAPLTVVNNVGVGHGGNSDNQFIRAWMDDVLSQRLPATTSTTAAVNLPSWQYNSSWSATYNVALTNTPPWGTSSIQGVQLANAAVSAKTAYADPRPATWLPSQKTANTWLTYTMQAVAYWKLDESTGSSSYDSSPNGITGTWHNAPTFSGTAPSGITFADPGCLSFNGSNQYVDMGNPSSLVTGTGARTICAWAKSNSTAAGFRNVVSYGTAATGEAMYISMNGTTLTCGAYGSDLTVANFWDTNWHFIVLTYDGATASLYADGKLVASAAETWNLVAGHCYIGCQVNGSQYWNGLIDDVRIYNYALPASQIYGMGSGAVAYWNLDEASGPYSYDSSPNDIVGTQMNAPTFSGTIPSGITFPDAGSMSFNGSNQYVDMGKPAALPTGAAPRTLCAWAKSNSVASGYRLIAAFGNQGTAQAMNIGMNGTTLVAGAYSSDLNVANFWDTNWHFIALTYDGTTANLYADGNLVASAALAWNLVPNHCYIGRQISGSQYWNGLIDDVRIYNSALSATQLSGIMH